MIINLASAVTAVTLLLFIWLIPLPIFLLTTGMRGIERVNWAILIIFLSWPAFALYLFHVGMRDPRP